MTTADVRAAELAKRQHGVVTRAQLLELGAANSTIARRLDSARWLAIDTGIYLIGGHELSTSARLRAATFLVPGSVVSHESAGRLHGLEPLPPNRQHHIDLTVNGRCRLQRPSLQIHQTASLVAGDVTRVTDIPTTTVERTVVDLASMVRPARCARILDNVLTSGVELDGIVAAFDRVAERGRPGTQLMRQLLDERMDRTAFSTSRLEQRFLDVVRAAGLPEPESQFLPPFADNQGFGRVDFAYPHARLIIELDGRRWHGRAADFETDRRRDQAAVAAGWTTVRFTWSDIEHHADRVVDIIRANLAHRAAA